jgi:hypothetical protein
MTSHGELFSAKVKSDTYHVSRDGYDIIDLGELQHWYEASKPIQIVKQQR